MKLSERLLHFLSKNHIDKNVIEKKKNNHDFITFSDDVLDNYMENFSNAAVNSIHNYSEVHSYRFYISYQIRNFFSTPVQYVFNSLEQIFYDNLYFNTLALSFQNFINEKLDTLDYFTGWRLSGQNLYDNFIIKDFFFNPFYLSKINDIIKENLFFSPVVYELYIHKNSANANRDYFFVSVVNTTLVSNLISSSIYLCFLSFIFLGFLAMIFSTFMSILNRYNQALFIKINNKIDKISEYDFGPNKELKFFFLFIFFFFLATYFNALNNVFNLITFKKFFIFYLFFLTFICVWYPVALIVCFGFYFLSYIKGANMNKSLSSAFFFDNMSLISYFSRFILQLVRIILFMSVYYLLHEYFFEQTFNSVFVTYPNVLAKTYPFLNFTIQYTRFLYELFDFFMILSLQLISFYSVMFILFSFLFSSNINLNYEKFTNKNVNNKN